MSAASPVTGRQSSSVTVVVCVKVTSSKKQTSGRPRHPQGCGGDLPSRLSLQGAREPLRDRPSTLPRTPRSPCSLLNGELSLDFGNPPTEGVSQVLGHCGHRAPCLTRRKVSFDDLAPAGQTESVFLFHVPGPAHPQISKVPRVPDPALLGPHGTRGGLVWETQRAQSPREPRTGWRGEVPALASDEFGGA